MADHGPSGPNGPRCQVTCEEQLYPQTPEFRARTHYLAFQAARADQAEIAV